MWEQRIQKKFPHLKHVYFVGEKHEPHILSSTAAILETLRKHLRRFGGGGDGRAGVG